MTNEEMLYKAKQVAKLYTVSLESLDLDDSTAMQMADLYDTWQTEQAYSVDKIVKYGVNSFNETQLYKVVQAHTSQADWTPDKATSMFKAIGITENGVDIWTQPLGGTDAYSKGDIVSYNDIIYVSTVDSNVWSPDVYGWEVQ